MTSKPITLEDAGWKAYWDSEVHHEIKAGDLFPVTPGGEVTISYLCKPVQEDDGFWYSNTVYLYEPWPALIGGVYKKGRIYSESFIGGNESAGSFLNGRIEEVSYWGKSIGLTELTTYQTTATGMIGVSDGDKYSDSQEAIDDMLYYYFTFDSPLSVGYNYIEDGAISIKSNILEIGSGKIYNSSILDREGDYIRLAGLKSEKEISLNIRFYVEEKKDFVLFDNNEIIKISFDESTGVFNIVLYPYIGNYKEYSIEIPNLSIHKWYDLGVLYEDGILYFLLNGEQIESNESNTINIIHFIFNKF